MALTPEEIQQQIILEVGDVDPQTGDPPTDPDTGIIATRMHFLWDRYAGWTGGMRELLIRAAAIRLVLGVLKPRRFDFSDTRAGLSVRAHQLVESYEQALEDTAREIAAARKTIAASGGASGGGYRGTRLVHAAPVEPVYPPDPNAMRYGGTVVDLDAPLPDDDVTSP